MKNAIRVRGRVCLFMFVLAAPALGQRWLQAGPPPAATSPAYDVSVGYTNFTMAIPGARHVNLNGLDLSGRMDLAPHWGVAVDANCARAPRVLGTPHDASELGLYAGPVFYALDHGNTRVSVHALGGVVRMAGVVPMNATAYFHGWVVRFSYAMGGGLEHSVSGPLAVRVNGDYVRTAFFDSAGAVRPQSDLRLTVGLVLHLRGASRSRTTTRE
jgi:hypothetical protein